MKTRLILVLGVAVLAAGCDKDALRLAQEALALLGNYEQRIKHETGLDWAE